MICNSDATAGYIMQRCGVSKEKIKVVHNGINVNRKLLFSDKFEKKTGFLRIAFVGRVEPHKGLKSLLTAMEYLPENNYCLDIIGDGVLLKEYMALYGAKKNIHFLGA